MKRQHIVMGVILVLVVIALAIFLWQPSTEPLQQQEQLDVESTTITEQEAIALADQNEEVISWKEQFLNPTRTADRGTNYWDVSYCSTEAVDAGEIAGSCITARIFDDKTIEILPILV